MPCSAGIRTHNEVDRLDFAEAYLVTQAEDAGVGTILSFGRSIDRVTTITCRES